ncbi:hypothetical protein AB0D10_25965 [Kitasatospora sp. NPDC048545]|uniref:hypothetical protein n=1 Tax=Kitasatospora sp. NPDC048545 TaxID=3157208 RepID=UPI0033EF5C78
MRPPAPGNRAPDPIGTRTYNGDDRASALVSSTATLTGVDPEPVISATTEILRRRPDGGWVHVVDDPFFH